MRNTHDTQNRETKDKKIKILDINVIFSQFIVEVSIGNV